MTWLTSWARAAENDSPDQVADARAARLAYQNHGVATGVQVLIEQPGLRALPAAFGAFECDK